MAGGLVNLGYVIPIKRLAMFCDDDDTALPPATERERKRPTWSVSFETPPGAVGRGTDSSPQMVLTLRGWGLT